ncbi:Cyclin-like protein [Pseudocohnilembus persalinus]|uniref:Cyclin-like protein n=1 Tax=Pseudocohnilembus persalinus TaxID=266149 RepID=A0A0V0QDW4_PSEPJ|nr:Cyclin-like protein [Pseudocohnilembus persalinus]|eukprot:KRX00357.1 Cyclin-like protein [Pseudocohnilembus persalinus]
MPGHQQKFTKLLGYIKEVNQDLLEDSESSQSIQQSPYEQFSNGLQRKQKKNQLNQFQKQYQMQKSAGSANGQRVQSSKNQQQQQIRLPGVSIKSNSQQGARKLAPYGQMLNHQMNTSQNSKNKNSAQNSQKPINFQQNLLKNQTQKNEIQSGQKKTYDIKTIKSQSAQNKYKKIEEIGGDFFVENENQIQEISDNIKNILERYPQENIEQNCSNFNQKQGNKIIQMENSQKKKEIKNVPNAKTVQKRNSQGKINQGNVKLESLKQNQIQSQNKQYNKINRLDKNFMIVKNNDPLEQKIDYKDSEKMKEHISVALKSLENLNDSEIKTQNSTGNQEQSSTNIQTNQSYKSNSIKSSQQSEEILENNSQQSQKGKIKLNKSNIQSNNDNKKQQFYQQALEKAQKQAQLQAESLNYRKNKKNTQQENQQQKQQQQNQEMDQQMQKKLENEKRLKELKEKAQQKLKKEKEQEPLENKKKVQYNTYKQQVQFNKNKNNNSDNNKNNNNKNLNQQQKQGISKDDIIITHKYINGDEQMVEIKENRILDNLHKNIVKTSSSDILKATLEYQKIKQMYISFDSGQLTSTILNLDIEELCYCLGRAVVKHIEFSLKQFHGINSQKYIEFMRKQESYIQKIKQNQKQKKLEKIEENQKEQDQNKEEEEEEEDDEEEKLRQQILEKFQQNGKNQEKKQNSKIQVNKEKLENLENQEQKENSYLQESNEQGESSEDMDDLLGLKNEKKDKFDSNVKVENNSKHQEDIQMELMGYGDDDDYEDFNDFKMEEIIAKGRQLAQQQINDYKYQYMYRDNRALSRITERNEQSEIYGQTIAESNDKDKNSKLFNFSKKMDKNRQNGQKQEEQVNQKEINRQIQENQSKQLDQNQDKDKNQNNNDDQDQDITREDFEQSRSQLEEILRESQMICKEDQSEKNIEIIDEKQINFKKDKNNDIQELNDDNSYVESEEEQNNDLKQQKKYNSEFKNQNDLSQEIQSGDNSELQDSQQKNENSNDKDVDQNQNLVQNKDQDQNLDKNSDPLEFSYESKYAVVEMSYKDEEDFLNNFLLFQKTFDEQENDPLFNETPTPDIISNFCKNILITSKMEKEVPIISLVYIERLLLNSQLGITGKNWRKIIFTAMVLASKIWDDESFESDNFAKAFPVYKTKEINEMERIFLQFIKYRLYVNSYDYAKYYFIMRQFANKEKKSFPLRSLDLQTILFLQKQSSQAQSQVEQKIQKEQYLSSLNKSF